MTGPKSARPVIAAALLALGTAAAAGDGRINGRVVDETDAALAGVFVTARSAASQIETTVYTGADGRFELPALAAGRYAVRAHHARHAEVTLELGADETDAALEFVLPAAADPLSRASTAEWFADVADGPRKREFLLNCATCHELNAARIRKDGRLRDRAGWLEAFALMKAIDVYAVIPPDFDLEAYAAWLAAELSADKVAKLAPPATASGAVQGERVVITEYPVPLADELPHDLVVGPDGRIWITAFWNSAIWAMAPDTGAFESYAVNATPDTVAQVRALAFDADGLLWLVNGGTESVVRLDPASRAYATYAVGMYPHDLVIDSRGDIWVNDYFAKRERVAHLAAATGTVTHHLLPSAGLPASAGPPLPYGLQIDGRDRLWSSQLAANTLARYDIDGGAARLYTMPGDNVGPRRMAVGREGEIWIPEFNTGRLTRFDPQAERFASFDTGIGAAGIYDVAVDPRTGDVWLAAALASALIHFDRHTHAFTRYPLPTEPAFMRHLAVDPETGDVWSAYSSLPTAVPKIVRLRRAVR